MKKNKVTRLLLPIFLLGLFSLPAWSLTPPDPATILEQINRLQDDTSGLSAYFKKDRHRPLVDKLQLQLNDVYRCVQLVSDQSEPVSTLVDCQTDLGLFSQSLTQTFGSQADLQILHVKRRKWLKAQGLVNTLLTQSSEISAALETWLTSSGSTAPPTQAAVSAPDPQAMIQGILYDIIALPRYLPGAADLRRSLYFSTRYATISIGSGQRLLASGDTSSASTQFSFARLRIKAYKTLLENRLSTLPPGSAPEIQAAIDQATVILTNLDTLITILLP